jgi:tripartite-type tricarboxylate transporter receptor subunit TctC
VISLAAAAEPVSFSGKTVTMIVGFAAGGGTDASGRLLANYLGKYLPGSPAIVVQNIPGADGLTAMNYFVQQVKPDGLTITMGSGSVSDPRHYRDPLSHFDPNKFRFIGGVGRGGSILVLRKDAERRLYDKSAAPVAVGATSRPTAQMESAAWGIRYLGWNAKWVTGYPGTNELLNALERGEVDMTSTSGVVSVQDLLDRGVVDVIAQLGTVDQRRLSDKSGLGAAPLFRSMMDHKIADPLEAKAFAYWRGLTEIDKWLAAPPGTPDDVVAAYRTAYQKLVENADFIKQSKTLSEDFAPLTYQEAETLIHTLGDTPPEATQFIDAMLHSQGL